MKSSPSIWFYVVNVKSTVKISPIFVAFLENMNFIVTFSFDFSLKKQKNVCHTYIVAIKKIFFGKKYIFIFKNCNFQPFCLFVNWILLRREHM